MDSKFGFVCGMVYFITFATRHALAEGPRVNLDVVESYAALAIKMAITITGILVFASAVIRAALAGLKKQASGIYAGTAQRELYEAIEGPIFWLIALALAAWLPDILVAVGLLPEGTPFSVKWSDIFGG